MSTALFLQNAFSPALLKSSFFQKRGEELVINKASRLIHEKKYSEATALLDRAIALRPDLAQFYYLRGAAKHFTDDFEGADSDALAAIEKTSAPKYEDYVLLAHTKYNKQDFQAAKQAAEDAVNWAAPQILPEVLRIHGLSALALYEEDSYEEDSRAQYLKDALEDFQKILDLEPENKKIQKALDHAENLKEAENITEALSLIEALMEKGRYFEAMELADQAIASYPRFAAFYGARGMIKIYLGGAEDALEDFEKFVSLEPDSREAYLSYAGAKYLTSDFAGAAEAAGRAIGLSSSAEEAAEARSLRVDSLINLAVVNPDGAPLSRAMWEIKKAAEAGEDLKKENLIRALALLVDQELVSFAPRRLDPYALIDFLDLGILDFNRLDSFNLSRLFFIKAAAKRSIGDYEGAGLDLVKAIEQNPDWHYHYEELARLKIERKDLMGALEAADAGLETSGGKTSPEAHYLRGAVLFDIVQAAANLPQNTILDPGIADQDQAKAISLAVKAARRIQGQSSGGEAAEAGSLERDSEAYFQSLSLLSDASKTDIQKALALDPGHQGAREALKVIDQLKPACRGSFLSSKSGAS